jgi:hypothetical protein
MKKSLLFLWCLAPFFYIHADVTQEIEMMGGMTSKTLTSGLKQRSETPNPMMGGSMVTITRVDQGVVWTLDTQQKIYEEKPIALPYKPQPTTLSPESKKIESTEPLPKIDFKKVPGTKTIAGYSAEGYQVLASNKDSGTMWMTPVSGPLQKIEKETEAYNEAYFKKLYENFPANERKELGEGMQALAGMMKGRFSTLAQDMKNMPKGFPLGMEAGEEMGSKMMIYQVKTLSAAPLDAGLFAIPAGYKKVNSLAEQQMKQMNGGNMEEMLKKMQSGEGNMEDMMKQMNSPEMQEMMKRMQSGEGAPNMQEMMKKMDLQIPEENSPQ